MPYGQYARGLMGAAALVVGLVTAAPLHAQDGAPAGQAGATALAAGSPGPGANLSEETRKMVAWVTGGRDNKGMPFVIVDKRNPMAFVFDGGGRLLGATPVLLGLARGDESAPGVGDKKLADIRPDERTTPAGRFVASLGHGLGPQDILWVDYPSALALHRVLPASSREHRLQQIASTSPPSRRVTFGCINVPTAFYDGVIRPAFIRTSGVVYILPEIKAIAEVFSGYASST